MLPRNPRPVLRSAIAGKNNKTVVVTARIFPMPAKNIGRSPAHSIPFAVPVSGLTSPKVPTLFNRSNDAAMASSRFSKCAFEVVILQKRACIGPARKGRSRMAAPMPFVSFLLADRSIGPRGFCCNRMRMDAAGVMEFPPSF